MQKRRFTTSGVVAELERGGVQIRILFARINRVFDTRTTILRALSGTNPEIAGLYLRGRELSKPQLTFLWCDLCGLSAASTFIHGSSAVVNFKRHEIKSMAI